MLVEKSTRYLHVGSVENTHYYFKHVGVENSSKEYWVIKNSIPKEAVDVKGESYSSGLLIYQYDIPKIN